MQSNILLTETSFGARVAEEEGEGLTKYFVETDQWRGIFDGTADVVRGPKGSGKSAIYSLLLSRTDELFDRNILVTAAENPRGQTVFGNLVEDPPVSDSEFIYLWKVYLLTLIATTLVDHGIDNKDADVVVDRLVQEKLVDLKTPRTIAGFLRAALDYVRGLGAVESIEGGVTVDPTSGLPAIAGRITFHEPSGSDHEKGFISVDELLGLASRAFEAERFEVWILLDRLDVAFASSRELEAKALRALFRVYNDFAMLSAIKLKVFLRSDIWSRVFEGGFSEASHITRIVDISWDERSLLNLIIKRALSNEAVVNAYDVDPEAVLDDIRRQEELFYRMFPRQVDRGQKKPQTLKWIVTRTQDGTKKPAPRELLHLLEEARKAQIRAYEVGGEEPSEEAMLTASVVKDALAVVSETRLEATLYAEYPKWKERIAALEEGKTEQSGETLAAIWGIEREAALKIAQELVEIGFFEERRDRQSFWVPFLYRSALGLSQGQAEV